MVLKGRITNEDYLAFQSRGNAADSDVLAYIAIIYTLHLVASVAVCYALDTRSPARDGVLLQAMAWAFVLLLRRLILSGLRRSALRHGFYNIGEATYELHQQSLHFSGTTFSCDIPYESMAVVTRYSNRAAIVFSPLSGFLLPGDNTIMEGDLDAFVEELGERLEAHAASCP